MQNSAIVPDKGIRAVKNSTGSTLAANVLVSIVAAGTEDPIQVRLPTGAGVKTLGVTMRAISDTHNGDVQVEGRAIVLAGAGGIAVGQEVSATTAGAAVAATAGHIIAGVCVKAAAAGVLGEIELGTAIAGRIVPA